MDIQQQDLLKDKVVLITGASDGIGKQLAKTYAKHGATVILLARNVKKLEQVYDEIMADGGPMPAIYPLDLAKADPDNYKELVQRIDTELGRLDIVVHNAAILGTLTPIEHYDIKQWYTVQQINLNAPFLLSQAAIPLMKKSKQAAMIFTTAPQARQGKAYWGSYSVAKFGLQGLAEILNDELENSSIQIHIINPGVVRTRLRSTAYPAEDPKQHPLPEAVMDQYVTILEQTKQTDSARKLNELTA